MKQSVDLNDKTILVTGSPGFIGANLVLRLLKDMSSGTIVSLDNMNDYYDPKLKEYRLSLINNLADSSPVQHIFIKGSIADKTLVDDLFEKYHFDIVVNLAAQAGVRYSIDHPDVYIESNIIGFYNILEACRHSYDNGAVGVEHLVYASSSSVYGGSKKVPFSTDDKVDNPVSLYAATKKSSELLAHSYSKLYNIPSTGLRFFTVYGPAGRPDMFYYSAIVSVVARCSGGVWGSYRGAPIMFCTQYLEAAVLLCNLYSFQAAKRVLFSTLLQKLTSPSILKTLCSLKYCLFLPTLFCAKKTGPGSSITIASIKIR